MPVDDPADLQRRVQRNTRCITALLILFVLLVIGGGAYAYVRAERFLQPRTLARTAVERLEHNYPAIRATVKQRLVEHAPELADRASREVVKGMPEARQQLGGYLERLMDVGLEKGSELSADQFRQFLRDNHGAIKKAFNELEESPDERTRLAADLDRLVEEHLGINIQKEARLVLELLHKWNAKLEALNQPEKQRTPAQDVERRIVRILRTIQVRETAARSEGSRR